MYKIIIQIPFVTFGYFMMLVEGTNISLALKSEWFNIVRDSEPIVLMLIKTTPKMISFTDFNISLFL